LGEEEVAAILNLLRVSNDKTLAILEQARFLAELKQVRGMSLSEIAESLSRSKAWVSMRLSLLAEMSEAVREKLFSGAFPVYAYMYVVRPFMRMNGVSPQLIDQFVEALSGHKLSLREIEQLAHGFFRGPDSFRQEILSGNIALPLQRMKEVPPNSEGCSDYERLFLHDLELAQKYMQRIMAKSEDPRLQSKSFHAQCHLLSAGILSRASAFHQTLRKLHDRSGQT
jgi:predicted transcriptional regulator